MLRILVAITDNEPGVLDRIASTFRRRGFNIHSLTVSPTLDPAVSRLTVVTDLDDKSARAARSFLERLVNIHSVADLTDAAPILRDTVLLRVAAAPGSRPDLFQIANLFQAEILDVGTDSMVLACSGAPDRIEALMESLRPFGLLEMGRTGAVAMQRCADRAAVALETAVSF
jgi:acetolactate synthase I/III small subunit